MKKIYYFVLLVILYTSCELYSTKKEDTMIGGGNSDYNSLPAVASTDLEAKRGEILFKQNCIDCHRMDVNDGFPLKYITEKYTGDEKWLYAFIRNSQEMIQQGDQKAIALFEANGKAKMPSYKCLSEDDIKAILLYTDNKKYP